jgi:uncharacterized membrane protein
MVALTIFDLVIVVLTWREYRQQRRTRNREAVTVSSAKPQTPSETSAR